MPEVFLLTACLLRRFIRNHQADAADARRFQKRPPPRRRRASDVAAASISFFAIAPLTPAPFAVCRRSAGELSRLIAAAAALTPPRAFVFAASSDDEDIIAPDIEY